MAGSVNKVILIGNLARDPEVRTLQNGDTIANLTVATSEAWTDRASGERKEKAEFHRVSVMNPHLAEIAGKYGRKGAKVYIEGALQTRKWVDKDGADRYSTEVMVGRFNASLHFLDRRPDEG